MNETRYAHSLTHLHTHTHTYTHTHTHTYIHTHVPAVYLSFGLIMIAIGGVFVAMWKSSYYGIRVADTRAINLNAAVAENSAFGAK